MAFVKRQISSTDWTLIAENVGAFTFQNVGSYPIYVNFSLTDTPPEEEVGLVYPPFQGEIQRGFDILSGLGDIGFVFVRAVSNSSSVIVEE